VGARASATAGEKDDVTVFAKFPSLSLVAAFRPHSDWFEGPKEERACCRRASGPDAVYTAIEPHRLVTVSITEGTNT
jgi:hypothetical protein